MHFEKIRDFIIEITSCEADEVTMEAALKEDLGMDSLDAMELVMMIRDELGADIPEDKLGEIVTVKNVVDFVDSITEK